MIEEATANHFVKAAPLVSRRRENPGAGRGHSWESQENRMILWTELKMATQKSMPTSVYCMIAQNQGRLSAASRTYDTGEGIQHDSSSTTNIHRHCAFAFVHGVDYQRVV